MSDASSYADEGEAVDEEEPQFSPVRVRVFAATSAAATASSAPPSAAFRNTNISGPSGIPDDRSVMLNRELIVVKRLWPDISSLPRSPPPRFLLLRPTSDANSRM